MNNYDYDEPEAAAIDLIEDKETDRIRYGNVLAKWDGNDVVFRHKDSNESYGILENVTDRPWKKAFEDLVRMLVTTDEEIRSEL